MIAGKERWTKKKISVRYFVMFMKDVSYAQQQCIYLTKNTVKSEQ